MREFGPPGSDESKDETSDKAKEQSKKVIRLPLELARLDSAKSPEVPAQADAERPRRFVDLLSKIRSEEDLSQHKKADGELPETPGIIELEPDLPQVEPISDDDDEDNEKDTDKAHKSDRIENVSTNEKSEPVVADRRLANLADLVVGVPIAEHGVQDVEPAEAVQEPSPDALVYEDLESVPEADEVMASRSSDMDAVDDALSPAGFIDDETASTTGNTKPTAKPLGQNGSASSASSPAPAPPVTSGSPGGYPGRSGGNSAPPVPPFGGAMFGGTPMGPNVPSSFAMNAAPLYAMNTLRTAMATPEHEHPHTHRRLIAAFGAGLLLEHYLGKRADRKLDRKLSKSVTELQRQIDASQSMQEQLTTAQAEQRQAMAALYEQQGTQQEVMDRLKRTLQETQQQASALAAAEAAPILNVVSSSAKEARQAPGVSHKVTGVNNNLQSSSEHSQHIVESHTLTQTGFEQAMPVPDVFERGLNIPDASLEQPRNLQTNQAEKLTSHIIMEQAAAAAEQNLAVEKVYERRSEIKDEPTAGIGSAGGSVAGASYGSSHNALSSKRQLAEAQAMLRAGNTESRNDNYKQAAKGGFVAAVIIIAVAIIIYVSVN